MTPALPKVFMFTDPRMGDPLSAAKNLPSGAAIVYRHFGAVDRVKTAAQLRKLATEKKLKLLIGADPELANKCKADGVHLPARQVSCAANLRRAHKGWILTAAIHGEDEILIANTQPLDAVILSPLFSSNSPSAKSPLGPERFASLAALSHHPVIALGGITPANKDQAIAAGAYGVAGVSMFAAKT